MIKCLALGSKIARRVRIRSAYSKVYTNNKMLFDRNSRFIISNIVEKSAKQII